MKHLVALLFMVSLLAIGCTTTKQTKPEQPKKTVAAKPAEGDVPPAVANLLPKEMINETNAKAQAQLLEEKMIREGGQVDQTETAKRK